jgi:hypothetical protein
MSLRLEGLLTYPKVMEDWLSGLFTPVFPPFDRLIIINDIPHGTEFSIFKQTLRMCSSYFLSS